MEKKFYVYETLCGECFITNKEVTKDWSATFKSVPDAENWVDEVGGSLYLDRDLISESQYSWVGDDYDINTMNADTWFNF